MRAGYHLVRRLWSTAPDCAYSGTRRSAPVRFALSIVSLLAGLVIFLGQPVKGQDAGGGPVLVFDVKGVIGFTSAQHLERSVERAKAEKASLIIMRIDTPGGLVSSTRDMIQTILASPIPIVGYVAPSGARAASAGTYLMYASHLAAMAPATHLGAATPIQMGAPGITPSPSEKKDKSSEPDAAERKLINDAVSYLRGLAELRGRNADWAEKAVREGATLTSTQAQEEKVIDFIAADLREVLEKANG